MATLNELKAKVEKSANEASVKMPTNERPEKSVRTLGGYSGSEFDANTDRVLEVGYIAKKMREAMGQKGLTDADKYALDKLARTKAAMVTTDIPTLIPDNLTPTLHRDMFEQTSFSGLISFKQISNNGITEPIAYGSLNTYLTAEANTILESYETYGDFIYLTQKLATRTNLSYESNNDSLIDLASEKRQEMVRSMAYATERAFISGDVQATHFDLGETVAASDPRKLCRGLRRLGLAKSTENFGGVAKTDAEISQYILNMQVNGGVYMTQAEVESGNVVLFVDQYFYNRLRVMDVFFDASKGGGSTLASGRKVSTVFGIPVVVGRFMPTVNQAGIISATALDNVKGSAYMVNLATLKAFTIANSGTSEMDRVITNQTIEMVNSLRIGFASVFDSSSTAPTTITGKTNIVAGINIFRA